MVAAVVAIAPSSITVTASPVTAPSTPARPHLQKRSSSFSNATPAIDAVLVDAVRLVHQQDAASSAAALSFSGPSSMGHAPMSPRSPSLKRSSFSAPRRSPLE
ncbi:hypothetical protein PINS_up008067 [Pythium insidiosum]|nr:hypothetical protein PINS_up008067 [Pythium insidiosum]